MPVEPQASAGEDVILDGGGLEAGSGLPQIVPMTRITDADAFHLCASLAELHLLPGGVVIPDIPPIYHTAGVNGASGTGNPGRAFDVARKKGRHIIPHRFTVVAFGEKRNSYITKSFAGKTNKGEEIWCYHDRWRRPVFLGSRFIKWEIDGDGYNEFRKSVMVWLLAQEGLDSVPAAYRDLVADRYKAEISHIANRDEPGVAKHRKDLQSRLAKPKPKRAPAKKKAPAKKEPTKEAGDE